MSSTEIECASLQVTLLILNQCNSMHSMRHQDGIYMCAVVLRQVNSLSVPSQCPQSDPQSQPTRKQIIVKVTRTGMLLEEHCIKEEKRMISAGTSNV